MRGEYDPNRSNYCGDNNYYVVSFGQKIVFQEKVDEEESRSKWLGLFIFRDLIMLLYENE